MTDPDIDVDDPAAPPPPRAVHLQWRSLGLVAVGGAIGTAARDLISTALPAHDGIGWAVLWINVVGAFLLGLLLEALAHRGPDEGRRRRLRLLLGTGVLGGFTTYSTLAVASASLLLDGRVLVGVGYALLTLLGGAVATALGLVVAGWIRPRAPHATSGPSATSGDGR